MQIFDIVLHFDRYLNEVVAQLGGWSYFLLFLIIFCETGLVVCPFLPGDSLLFAVGALCAVADAALDLSTTGLVLFTAAVAGDAVNYSIGSRVGPRVFSRPNSRFFKKEHLVRTRRFYDKHGGKTIVLARFIPIIRTFAPFVAGVGAMRYRRFAAYNVVGGTIWVLLFLTAGYFFGNLPVVKDHFHLVLLAIIAISFLPVVIEWLRAKRARRGVAPDPVETRLPAVELDRDRVS